MVAVRSIKGKDARIHFITKKKLIVNRNNNQIKGKIVLGGKYYSRPWELKINTNSRI